MKKLLSAILVAEMLPGVLCAGGTTDHNGENKWTVFAGYQEA